MTGQMDPTLEQVMPRLQHLFAGTIGVSILEGSKPMFTVVPGGKQPDDAA